MNNGDMPAMPLSGDAYQDFAAYDGTRNTSYNPECQGMTKREYFAVKAMQGMLSKTHRYTDFQLAEAAVKRADALLKTLEANNG